MDNQHLKDILETVQTETENDSCSDAVLTIRHILGDIVLVRVGQSLDLTVFFTFMSAAQAANANPRTELILVDLDSTMLYFESGTLMLQQLREQLQAPLKDRIFLYNASPKIKQRLELELPPAQFHLGSSTNIRSSAKLH